MEPCALRDESCKLTVLHHARVMAENIIELTYGRREDEEGRDYVKLNSYLMEVSIKAIEGYMVDFVPACKHASPPRYILSKYSD